MSIRTTLNWIWEHAGRSDTARRRNLFVVIVILLAAIVGIFYSGGISITLSKVFQ